MPRMLCEGFEALARELAEEPLRAAARTPRLLQAGAQAVAQGWREEAEERDFRRTGGLIASIGYEKTAGRARDLRYIDIYPQGKDRRGTRYAAVAYILHYGTPGSAGARAKRHGKKFPGPGIPKTLWVDDAEARSEEKAREAMRRAWEEG